MINCCVQTIEYNKSILVKSSVLFVYCFVLTYWTYLILTFMVKVAPSKFNSSMYDFKDQGQI